MDNLNKLVQLPSVVAAFEVSDRGELKQHLIADDARQLDQSVLDLLGHICIANQSIATMQARGWEKLTGMGGFYPVDGFTLIGMDWSVVIFCNTGVVLSNENADYQAAFDALQETGEAA